MGSGPTGNGLEFSKLKHANEYLRTMTLDSTTQLTVNGLDIPLAVSDALIKDELGSITDITAVRYNLAGEWFDVPRPEAHMGMPSAQSLLTSVLRRGGDLPAKILETEPTIQGNEATLARLHTALDYESPYEAKLKEYEQRLAEIDKELLARRKRSRSLSMLRRKNCRLQRPFRSNANPRTAKIVSTRTPSRTDLQFRLRSMILQAKPSKCRQSRLLDSKEGNQSIEDARRAIPDLSSGTAAPCSPGERSSEAHPPPCSRVFSINEERRVGRNVSADVCPFRVYAAYCLLRSKALSCTYLIVVQNGITGPNWLGNTNGADGTECN